MQRYAWIGLAIVALACGVADEEGLPSDVQDPETLKTPAGAMARYREALAEFATAFDGMMMVSGVLTDELANLPLAFGLKSSYTDVDSRMNLASVSQRYSDRFHRLRAQAREARGFLHAFAPDSSPALAGHLYSIEGYAEIFLADLFCSGIPLSTVDFDGDFTFAAGSTTDEVYQHAVFLFDSALGVTGDSLPLQHVAAVGKGRALLALGQYTEAAAAVAAVPDNFRYRLPFRWSFVAADTPPDSSALMWYGTRVADNNFPTDKLNGASRMGDLEGGNGLDYRSSGDPRTLAAVKGRNQFGTDTMYFPRKYTIDPATTPNPALANPVLFTISDGIEARLIEAEAALQANAADGVWLDKLNHLRQTAWINIVPEAAGPLPDLVDPGTADARVDLLFRERAFWLYLTGHRQGDLRRLARNYLRDRELLYPTGAYPGGDGVYGTDIVVPMPESERRFNPKYTGCIHQNA